MHWRVRVGIRDGDGDVDGEMKTETEGTNDKRGAADGGSVGWGWNNFAFSETLGHIKYAHSKIDLSSLSNHPLIVIPAGDAITAVLSLRGHTAATRCSQSVSPTNCH